MHFQHTWNVEPDLFHPTNDWQAYRNKLVKQLPGIGYAKTSFAIEMLYPTEAQCLCLDRHMLKSFGFLDVDETVTENQYMKYESYWLETSNSFGVPPAISRNIWWDQIQKQPNSLYWAKHL